MRQAVGLLSLTLLVGAEASTPIVSIDYCNLTFEDETEKRAQILSTQDKSEVIKILTE